MKSCLTFGVFLFFWMSFISISAIPLPTNEDVRSKSKLGQNGIVRSYLVGAVLTQAEERIILKNRRTICCRRLVMITSLLLV